MYRFLCGRLVLFLIGVVGLLQLIHIILLNRLESRQRRDVPEPHSAFDPGFGQNEGEDPILEKLSSFAVYIERNWVLDTSGEYHLSSLQPITKSLSVRTQDITLVTQCSQEHLSDLIPLSQQWMGPLSIAVFARSGHEWSTLLELAKLVLADEILQTSVTFSFVWPVSAAGGLPPRPDLIPQHNTTESNYNHTEPYPNNLLRNTARRAAVSDFVFVIDVDMMPNKGLREDFLHLAARSRWFQKNFTLDKTVFVIPAFEGIIFPTTKFDLIQAVQAGKVRPFYSQLCWKCHAHTDYETWLQQPEHKYLVPTYDVLWRDPWEPFYISLNSVPLYDERFKQYGFNRISQVCELHVAGYKFTVLNKAFLLHKGFKRKESFHPQKEQELEFNRKLFRQFKTELKNKYAESSRRCY
ncbi:Beta-1,4-glucuronyltransferase 1 [Frankliniella fusca]|uniref:Beta-1,4-glucuronyltransferase 1 n=1 Tax=Frankliniella fusca TaxID=407009 RepID=A0AAE1GUG0_9NEOP|nr:Beta-1,4-glucuronyltransferase 1 [Frankliniella fusca]